MEKNEVVRLFNTKIRLEQKRFERSIKKLGTEKIYDKAYMITCWMNICESLLQKSADMDLEILQCLLVVPDVIRMFYIRWMRTGDSFQQELEICMEQEMKEIYQILSQERDLLEKKDLQGKAA